MKSKAALFFEGMKGKTVSFVGAGVSHFDCIRLFREKGIRVLVRDRAGREKMGETADRLEAMGVSLILGEGYLQDICEDVLFRTPGMKFYTPELTEARARGVVVTSEMEVFFALCPCRIIGVTGSDGKTTSTTILSEFLKAEGKTVHLGGNIGRALLPIVEEIGPEDFAVVELSSFQLISMRQSPDIALITNVAPNHLDMHKDMAEYVDAKRNLYLHQGAFSKTVLNFHNDITRSFAEGVRGDLYWFDRFAPVARGAFLNEEGVLCMADGAGVHPLFHKSEIRIPGEHNVENYLGAIAAAWGLVSPETMRKVAAAFGGVEHRIEFVRELDGVRYYNDSIASSPTRSIAGLRSFDRRIIMIAGGYDKKIPYDPLGPVVAERVKVLVLMGATAEKIEAAVTGCPAYDPQKLQILHAADMAEAVAKARAAAQPGDIVSLSPASASFDLYKNFEVRGNHYKDIVNAL
ncbi:UDP-N-acetylmuramoyl-L-alanine--D-glutamate ligase [Bittarella massiliensis (ex Durand et al. 2017)]|uniref:UDP-N-acetylmuramoyl-L-alanine--D-glutamate ligase n=1 Tax=Bittarella massiliensis (ex Durand et al. 2017) TaxID=1720313 RepID=UPI001AA1A26B|nr:UDP-N-acetylmuramoyl-L-alanine--D-glutamate ligase [Bittarella massiliensis (ex Durand et al. 2017)]MBO1679878.1 UDP-N-acetylmuramoyl-L-alanine--D-glutamate ligase [Bittarella massiliensis (ex Durand et al. 2017)]